MVDAKHEDRVKDAFLLCNKPTLKVAREAISLSKLLAEPDQSKLIRPTFITDIDPSQVSHTQRAVAGDVKKRVLGNLLK